jgi:hypothetical protein
VTPPRVRRLALTAHVASSVGWLGAVIAFLGLAFVGITHDDAQIVRATYLVMEPAAWFVLVPLAIASFVTGIVQGLLSRWGMFQHYWVVFKLYMQTFDAMADVAADESAGLGAVRNPSPVLHAAAALVLLLAATVLAVFKPRGLTPYGRRKQHAARVR